MEDNIMDLIDEEADAETAPIVVSLMLTLSAEHKLQVSFNC